MNTNTPKPITKHDKHLITDRSPIGTRYTDGEDTYTLVAYSVNPHSRLATPLFIADGDPDTPLTHWYDRTVSGSIEVYDLPDVLGNDDAIQVAEPDTEKSTAALTALTGRTEPTFRDTRDFTQVTLYADLNTDDEVNAFLAYAKDELKLREAQRLMERASQERSDRIARLVDLMGSQPKVAKALGLNQSTISRALRERRPEQP